MYKGIIVYKDGRIEESSFKAKDYPDAMAKLNRICLSRIKLTHEEIVQILLTVLK